jgi:epoxyqueuosine reductase
MIIQQLIIGTCTACIDSCPYTSYSCAYIVDGSKCISYFTIELKENIPQEMKGSLMIGLF